MSGRRPAAVQIAAAVGTVLLLGACADAVAGPPPPSVPSVTATATHGEWSGDGGMRQPGPFEVRYDDDALLLYPYTFCYDSGCADGIDSAPPSVGSPDAIFVHVPVDDLDELSAEQYAGDVDDACEGRYIESDVEPLGDGWWRVTPRGPAGDYRVSLFAAGESAGDMVADVMWTTPSSSPLPDAEATLALIADHGGEPDSYGLELTVSNLPVTPRDASATITVTAGNGRSQVIEAHRTSECVSEGMLYFDGPDAEAKQAAALGDFPFTLRVELVLDGVTHVATATYPDDEIEDNAPHVRLEFTPPLS